MLFLQIDKTNSCSSSLFAEKSNPVQLKLFTVELGQQFEPNLSTLAKMSEVKAVILAFST